MKVGTRIKIINGGIGCLGANGRCGVVTNKPANAGLCEYEVGYNVEVDDGYVWRINEYAVVEKLAVPVNNDNPIPKLETGMIGVTNHGTRFIVMDDHIVYETGGYDWLESINSEGESEYFNIRKLYSRDALSFDHTNLIEPIWDRKSDPKKQRIKELKEKIADLSEELDDLIVERDYLESQL